MYLSSPIVLVRLVCTCCLQYIHVNGIHCVSECVMSSSGESWDLATAITTISLRYHPITHSGMGRTLRKWGQSGENEPMRGESWVVLTNQRAWWSSGNYGWISDNIPVTHPCPTSTHCLDSGKTFTTASVTWSLGINKTGRCPLVMEMNGQWNWTTMVVITPVYIKHREQLESIQARVI